MPLFLREIYSNRWEGDDLGWLGENEFPADPIGDLRTANNELSIWEIDSKKTLVPRIIAALAIKKDKLDQLEYIIFDSKIFKEVGLREKKDKGGTPDKELNENNHYNLIKISAQRLIELAKIIHDDYYKKYKGTVLPEEVLAHILDSLKNGNFKIKTKKKEELIKNVDKLGSIINPEIRKRFDEVVISKL